MIDHILQTLVNLSPKWNVAFKDSYASLVRRMNAPVVDDPDGLVVFGNSSALYLAKVADPGAVPYIKLPKITATTFIHGWVIDDGNLYVADGFELGMWNLGDGLKRHTLQLIDDSDVASAQAAFAELKKAVQSAEWAALLEQAEDEFLRVTAQQGASAPISDERDRLDSLAADYFMMLKAMRKMVGSTGGGAAARQKVADLRKALADKRKAAAPWSFSAPVVRQHGFQEAGTSVFVMQGNGTLHGCDKQLTGHKMKKWKDSAELQIALIDELTSAAKLVAYLSESTLYAVDAKSLDEKSHWSPTPAPAANTTHSLIAANGQFWWSTEQGVFACKPDDQSILQPTWRAGAPWSARQVGRMNSPETIYNPSPDPNHLFESMNVHGWIAQRSDQSAPLTDGATAQLMLSDENGSYMSPPASVSLVLYGPFSRDAGATNTWGEVKAHPRSPLVLLSDTTNTSILSRYPTRTGISQLLPQWSVSPSLGFVHRGSATDIALGQPWLAPPVRPRAKPQPDMIDFLNKSAAKDAIYNFEYNTVPTITLDRRPMGDRELRYVIWYALFKRDFRYEGIMKNDGTAKKVLDVFYNDTQAQALQKQFAGLGTVWDFRDGKDTGFVIHFMKKDPPIDFDPPYNWDGRVTSALFHKPPPDWYDPWGYNRPGDFVPTQPAATYFDPFCFNGNLRFPQRAFPLESGFKGRQWAVFTDTDQPSLQASARSDSDTTPEEATTEPSVLVVRTDDDKQQTLFYVLPAKRLNTTYDPTAHEFHPEALPYAFVAEDVLGSPTVFFDPAKIYPAAWCAGSKDYLSVRLRKIASVDPAKNLSLWDTFVNTYKSQYGPPDGQTAWKIDLCPLPLEVLAPVTLYGYLLPKPQ